MDSASPEPHRFLRRPEAAKHVREKWGVPCADKTLAKLAVVGGGPPFREAGRVPLYDPPDLDAWVRSKLSRLVSSTSELADVDRTSPQGKEIAGELCVRQEQINEWRRGRNQRRRAGKAPRRTQKAGSRQLASASATTNTQQQTPQPLRRGRPRKQRSAPSVS
jgi:hypothetical protein